MFDFVKKKVQQLNEQYADEIRQAVAMIPSDTQYAVYCEFEKGMRSEEIKGVLYIARGYIAFIDQRSKQALMMLPAHECQISKRQLEINIKHTSGNYEIDDFRPSRQYFEQPPDFLRDIQFNDKAGVEELYNTMLVAGAQAG